MSQLTLIKRWFSRDIGRFNEEVAVKFLKKQGLTLISTNFDCRFGELDLIMADQDVLVFVEVKFRSSRDFGGAIAAISKSKQRKLIRTAEYYLQQHKLKDRTCRFDVIAIEGDSSDNNNINWIKNAFYSH